MDKIDKAVTQLLGEEAGDKDGIQKFLDNLGD